MTASVFLQGFGTCAALIIAIGAQNAFVLRQGLKREFVFSVALLCALSDALLVTLGVLGVGALVQSQPLMLATITYAGAIFLLGYGVMAARRAWSANTLALNTNAVPDAATQSPATVGTRDRRRVLLACLAFTFLNPHCYLDTVVLMGALGAQFPGVLRWVFAAGAVTASFVWFFSLAYGARLLAPVFARPNAWRVLDSLIALTMFALAAALVWRQWKY